mgnify:CR=1 FL=1
MCTFMCFAPPTNTGETLARPTATPAPKLSERRSEAFYQGKMQWQQDREDELTAMLMRAMSGAG